MQWCIRMGVLYSFESNSSDGIEEPNNDESVHQGLVNKEMIFFKKSMMCF